MCGWRVERLGGRVQIDEFRLGRLFLVGPRISLPGPSQEAQREAVGDIAVGVVDRVCVGLGEAAEWDQVWLRDPDPGLLGQLVDRRPGKAPTWLRGAGRQTLGSVIGAFGQQDASIVSLYGDHRAGHQDEVVADRLSQPPKVGVPIGHEERVSGGSKGGVAALALRTTRLPAGGGDSSRCYKT